MLSPRHRYPSRGSVAAGPAARPTLQAMLPGPPEGVGIGEFAGNEGPPQDLNGTAIRELRVSTLDVGTAVRLGDTSSKPRYFGTEEASPQTLQSPSQSNSDDNIAAGIVSAGNAPQAMNKNANQNGAPRIARTLPQRPL